MNQKSLKELADEYAANVWLWSMQGGGTKTWWSAA